MGGYYYIFIYYDFYEDTQEQFATFVVSPATNTYMDKSIMDIWQVE